MPSEAIRVGVVDSGCSEQQAISASAAFVLADQQLWLAPAEPDQLGHGTRTIEVIQALAPQAEVLSAQVFQHRLTTTAAQVAAAIDWLVEEGAQVINLSLGLRQDRAVLREACERALKQGVLICASSPARGEPVFPAHYAGVFRMTGDARCGREEISHLDTDYADFGACVLPLDNTRNLSGASLGCAHLSGHLARYRMGVEQPGLSAARQWLIERSRYQGPERRGAEA